MKRGFNILLILCAALVMLSCSNSRKSYTEMLKDQRKAIDKLIDQENMEILTSYPMDSVFGENQFVKLSNGVYMNVIDPGNGRRAVFQKTDVLTRFTASYFMTDTFTISNYGPHSNGMEPVAFKYGYYTASNTGYTFTEKEAYLNSLMSEGLQTPLEYVGDRAKVKLIVPFQKGNTTDQGNGDPVYYRIVEYKFAD